MGDTGSFLDILTEYVGLSPGVSGRSSHRRENAGLARKGRPGLKLFVRDRQFYRSILHIAVPIVLQSLITTGVNMMDTIMLTSCGETQLSASSLANQFISLQQFLCMGLGSGAAVLTAQYWGVRDVRSIRSVTTLMLRLCMLVAVAFMAVTLIFPLDIMEIYTPDKATALQGVRYLDICAYTLPLHALVVTLTCVLRSVHKVQVPLYASIVAFFVNIFFNWVFIYGELGAPRMEIAGAALGTLIARAVECLIILTYFFLIDRQIGYRVRHLLLPCRAYLRKYLRYSLPVVASDTLLGLGSNMISVIMGHISTGFVSAFAVVSLITRMCNVLTMGMANVSSTITGNTLGAGQKQKAYEQGVTFLVLSVMIGVFASCVIFLISPFIITHTDLTLATQEIARQQLLAVNITIIFSATQSVLTKGVLRGGGDTRFLLAADIAFLWLVSVPLGYLTGIVWELSPFMVYLSMRVDWIIKSIWCTFRLLQGRWVENQVTEQV